MQFEQINFETWIYMSREYMTLDMIKSINPFVGSFYRYDNMFLQINTTGSTMWVTQALGKGHNWFGPLLKIVKNSNIKDIMWMTNVNNTTINRWSKYINAELVDVIPNHYGEYSANQWVLDVNKPNKRFPI